jgi:hypothetical protein
MVGFRLVAALLPLLALPAGPHGDDAHHRGAEVAARILNAAVGPWA